MPWIANDRSHNGAARVWDVGGCALPAGAEPAGGGGLTAANPKVGARAELQRPWVLER